ncbi:hypothetical protein VNI00_006316 [Paramarasmius palmivorus]|uniref:Uncharacterized protein n=1 Tax=Paramarasmius palmivorus TaxID=297713 RepID=A0AAW0D8P6_9AGAR
MVYEMFGWIGPRHLELATYCCQIQTPSANYLAELDKFEPSCAVAVVWMKRGMTDVDVLMVEFRNWLQWAKSLRRTTPQRFIKRMETFLDGFYIVYPIEHLRLQAIEQVFEMESSLRPFERDEVDRYNSQAFYPKQSYRFASSYFQQQWFKSGEDKDDKYTPIKEYEFRPPLQFILPTTSDLSMTLPDGYVPVHITKANAEMLAMVYRVYNSLENDAHMVFNDDVIHDTSVSVRLGLVKEEDLAAFKKLLYERRDFLENPRSYLTPLPSTSLSQHGQSPHNEFNLCWYTCLAFVGLLVALVVPLAIGMAGYS